MAEEKNNQRQGNSHLPDKKKREGHSFKTRPVVKEGGTPRGIKHY